MGKVVTGKAVPDFKLPATGGQTIRLGDFRGRNLVLYFYPRDNTSGCTLEGQSFRDQHARFKRLHTEILGVSRDSLESHAKFRDKYAFQFDLLSDAEERVCKLFDVIREKSLYGHKFMGIERSTFLIDTKGVLRNEWRKVKIKGHVDEVLHAVKALRSP